MGRRSTSSAPIAQLRRLLGQNMTAAIFAANHGIRLDHLKKIESESANEVLSEKDAQKIGLKYGLSPESLRRKRGELIAIDGQPATVEKINAWNQYARAQEMLKEEQDAAKNKPENEEDTARRKFLDKHISLLEESGKALARAASRQIYELFLAAGQTGDALALAASFAAWKEEEMGNKRLVRALEEIEGNPRFVTKRAWNLEQLRGFMGKGHPILNKVGSEQQVEAVVKCWEDPVPLISFQKIQAPPQLPIFELQRLKNGRISKKILKWEPTEIAPSYPQLGLVFGMKSRRYDIELRSDAVEFFTDTVVRKTCSLVMQESGVWRTMRISTAERPKMTGLIVMGVSGSGNGHVGKMLAERLGWSFLDADDSQPPANIEKLREGVPLTTAQRKPWLQALKHQLETAGPNRRVILACSALNKIDRRKLVFGVSGLSWVFLRGSKEAILAQMEARKERFTPDAVLDSQIAVLNETADPWVFGEFEITRPLSEIVEAILSKVSSVLENEPF